MVVGKEEDWSVFNWGFFLGFTFTHLLEKPKIMNQYEW